MANPTIIGPIGFDGGLNLQGSYIDFPPNQQTVAQNVNIFYNKAVRRGGSQRTSAPIVAAQTVDGIGWWNDPTNGSTAVAHLNGELYSKNLVTGGAWTRMGSASSALGTVPTFTTMGGYLIVGLKTNGQPVKWDGTNLTALGATAPNGNIVLAFNNFCFVAGDSANPSRLYWSNVIDPTTFSATNYVEVRKNTADVITALAPGFNNDVLVFTQNSISSFSTTSITVSGSATIGPLTVIQEGIGCIAYNAVDVIPDGRIVFMDKRNHVYIYNGASFNDITDKPYPKGNVQSFFDPIQVNSSKTVIRVFAALHQIWILAQFTTGSSVRSVMVYNYQQDIWESNHLIDGTAMGAYFNETGGATLGFINGFYVGDSNGVVYDQGVSPFYDTDSSGNTVAISMSITKPVYIKDRLSNANSPAIISIVDASTHANANNTYTINYGFNGRTETILSKTFTYDKKSTTNPYRQVCPLNNQPGLISNVVVNFSCSNSDLGSNGATPFAVNPFFITDQVQS